MTPFSNHLYAVIKYTADGTFLANYSVTGSLNAFHLQLELERAGASVLVKNQTTGEAEYRTKGLTVKAAASAPDFNEIVAPELSGTCNLGAEAEKR
jgi:hypothetical protein